GNTAHDPSVARLEERSEQTLDALNPLTWLHTAQRIVDSEPDVLLLQWWTPFWLPLYGCIAAVARRAHIPILFLCHQLVEPDSPLYEWRLARIGLGWADALVSVSAREREMLRRAFPNKPLAHGFLPVYDGFPEQSITRAAARAQLGIAPDVPLLLFFGFVRRYKGLRYLLDALARVSLPMHLLIAGEFWEDEQLYREQITRHQLSERVMIHNRYIANEEVERYFVAADAVALPYLSGSQSAVGATALHFGVPIITTSVGGLAETVKHKETGLVVAPADSAQLAAAIATCFGVGVLDTFRSQIARERERLSWPALIETIERLSRDVIAQRGTEKAQAIHAST
ncbi:MAG: glycosyltransferase, partial [Chloroflexi bacterium]|nr:glycosyltransferase [Chloroflexota bacterium]